MSAMKAMTFTEKEDCHLIRAL